RPVCWRCPKRASRSGRRLISRRRSRRPCGPSWPGSSVPWTGGRRTTATRRRSPTQWPMSAATGCCCCSASGGPRAASPAPPAARGIPPTRQRLLDAANRLHVGADRLTVAGRALTKHVHRSAEAFWGVVKGSAEEKNAAALRVLNHILDNTTWWNVFGHFQHE